MKRLTATLGVAMLAIGLVGCASTGGPSLPCEKCEYGYEYKGKRTELRKYCRTDGDKATCCIKDGKMLDCSKNPPECPECAKAAQK